jgi:phasin
MRETNPTAAATDFPGTPKETAQAIREMTEKGAAQAKDSYEKMSAATTEASDAIKNACSTAAQGAMECNAKVIEFARVNSNANFDYATKLLGAKSPSEFFELSTQHARKQLEVLSEQTKELAGLGQKTMLEAAQPLKAGAAKMFQTPLL